MTAPEFLQHFGLSSLAAMPELAIKEVDSEKEEMALLKE